MSRIAIVFCVLAGGVGCSDRSLVERRPGSLSLVATAAQEVVLYGNGHTPTSNGTWFAITVDATNLSDHAALTVKMTRGQVRSAAGDVLMSELPVAATPAMLVRAAESQRLAFGVETSMLKTCPLECAAPTSEMQKGHFWLDAVFLLDHEEVPVSAATDLYCNCQENF